MKLLKGLYTDSQPIDQPEGTWRNARNIVVSKKLGAINNEDGFFKIVHTKNNIGYPTDELRPIGYITLDNSTVVLFSVSTKSTVNISEIGIMREEAPKVSRIGYFLEQDIVSSFSAGTGQTLFDADLFYTIRIRVTNNQATTVRIEIPQGTVAFDATITADTEVGYTIPADQPSILITNSNSGNPVTVEIVTTTAKYYERIIRDDVLNFSTGYPVHGVYKKAFNEDTIIAFTDKYNPTRILNLTDPAMAIDLTGRIIDSTKADLLELFVKVAVPSIEVISMNDAGGQLVTGTYFAAIAYELEDGGVSNVSVVANPVTIYDDARVDNHDQVDGSVAGEATSKSIRYKITNVDERYTSIRLYMIKMIDQIVTSDLVGRFRINGSTSIIEYTGTEVVENVPLDEVLVDKAVYSRIGTLTNYLNRLYGADLEVTLILDYQKYANNITANWVFEDQIAVGEVEGSSKDSVFMFLNRGYQNDEIYAFYITPILASGVRGPAFHIPGRAPLTGNTDGGNPYTDNDLISDLSTADNYLQEDQELADSVKYFQTRETATSANVMGFWENANEFYPDNEDSEIWEDDGTGQGIQKTTGEITLGSQRVRHHKFPALRSLIRWQGPIYTSGNFDNPGATIGTSNFLNATELDFVTELTNGITQSWMQLRSSTMDAPMGTIIDNPTPPVDFVTPIQDVGYVAAVDQEIKITLGPSSPTPGGDIFWINGKFTTEVGPTKLVVAHFRIRHLDANNGLLETLVDKVKDNSAWTGTQSTENFTDIANAPQNLEFEDPANPSPDPTTPIQESVAPGDGSGVVDTSFDDVRGEQQLPDKTVFQEEDPAEPGIFSRVAPVINKNLSTSTTGDEIFQTSTTADPDEFDQDIGSHEVRLRMQAQEITTFVRAGEKIVIDAWFDYGVTPAGTTLSQWHFTGGSFFRIDAVTQDSIVASANRGNILGIKFSNIFFPDEILEKIQGFEISYARRTIRNQTIIGQSILFPYQWDGQKDFIDLSDIERTYKHPWRWHGFDSMATKSNLFPTHLAQQCVVVGDVVDLVDKQVHDYTGTKGGLTAIDDQYFYEAGSETEYLRLVKNVKYLATDNAATEPDNEKREECMTGEMDTKLNAPVTSLILPRWLTNAVAYKQNIYQSREEQELVATGRIWRTAIGNNTYATGNLYGGDTFTSMRGLVAFAEPSVGLSLTGVYRAFLFMQMGALNPGLRHEGEEWFEYYYPKTNLANPVIRLDQIPNGTLNPDNPDELMGPTDGASASAREDFLKSFSEHYAYNNDYTAINQYPKSIPYTGAPAIENFPTRIARSEISPEVETEESWRNFLVLDVFDQERKRGAIHHLEAFKDQLIIQHERGTYLTRGTQVMRTDALAVYLGTGDLFDNPPTEILTSKEGYAGNVSSWASLLTKAGYFFIDADQGKVFLLAATLDEISNKGNRNWFRDNLPGSRNNPFFADGYTVAYDETFNRILLTKRGTGAFTISYSLDFNAWVCHHEYLPSAMWNTRRNIYSYAHGDENGTLVQHNDYRVKGKYYEHIIIDYRIVSTAGEDFPGEPGITMKLDAKYGDVRTYFDVPQVFITLEGGVKQKYNIHSFFGVLWNNVNTFIVVQGTFSGTSQTGLAHSTVLPRNVVLVNGVSFIEPVFTDPAKKWFSISWLSEVLNANLVNQHNQTLTDIIVYTFRQCSGQKTLVPLTNVRRTKSGWKTKDFKDIVKDKDLPFFDSNGELIDTNLTPNATYWKKRKFQDNYLIVRFIYDNVGDNNLYLYSVDANMREQIR